MIQRGKPDPPPNGAIKLKRGIALPPMGYAEYWSVASVAIAASAGAKVFYVDAPGERRYFVPEWCHSLLTAIGPGAVSAENRRALVRKGQTDKEWRAAVLACEALGGAPALLAFIAGAPEITPAGVEMLHARGERLARADREGDHDDDDAGARTTTTAELLRL